MYRMCWFSIKLNFFFLYIGDRIPDDKLEAIARNVITECDVINDGNLAFTEFEHVVARSPDFASLFHITI